MAETGLGVKLEEKEVEVIKEAEYEGGEGVVDEGEEEGTVG